MGAEVDAKKFVWWHEVMQVHGIVPSAAHNVIELILLTSVAVGVRCICGTLKAKSMVFLCLSSCLVPAGGP